MGLVREFRDEVVVAGWSCKLPGANSISELWSLLREGRCAVSQVPEDRFSLQRYLHPRRQERGKSYSFRAGIVDDIFGFDPTIFGISPREAEQMDPQQRLLLQLTWEALEDAGIRPSAIAGEEVGVFVGGSLTDYSHPFMLDQAVGDAYFATGNALAALSNRISYCFNLKGPSLTVDTACSSSLVALNQAVNEIRSGRIDTAIVAGINVIGSPMSFITFSQASMLSPTGLCHAFDAEADGFVRAEGGVAIVLRKASVAKMDRNPVRGIIVAADVNSDGRTGGMALPSWEAQHDLLNRVYARAGVNPSALAFVEAHGTGTAVGDPAEARALGQGLGQKRGEKLTIGSIKTNIGHLEPAAGLTGLLKALLSLNNEYLPASLHFKNPNPHIDFENLNLAVCDSGRPLPGARGQFAGVNSFGFGGTNAHVIVAAGSSEGLAASALPTTEAASGRVLTISAETRQALAELAGKYVGHVETLREDETATVAAAAAWRREKLRHRLVVSGTGQDEILAALKAHGAGDDHPLLTTGQASGDGLATALVFSGNGGQRAGMGIAAYKASADFRARFDRIDGYFQRLAGWSLKDAMFDPALGERLHLTSVAQPLIFAIQSAMAGALRARGIVAAAVLGHSVGEVAAAEAAGIIDTQTATRIIYYRSKHQERTHDTGGMAVLGGPADLAAELLAPIAGVEMAAHNSPRAVTVAGSKAGLQALKRAAQLRGIAFIDLNLNYPFHTSLMTPIKDLLIRDLEGLAPVEGTMPFISTVTGAQLPFFDLGADYWWHNVRQPVRFSQAIVAAAKLGIRTFIEVSPNSVLTKHITDCLIGETQEHVVLACPDARDSDAQPFDRVVARALIAGATIEASALFGPDPGGAVPLPHYPWQKTRYRYKPTVEAVDVVEKDRHPLSGVRAGIGALEWHAHIDTALIPELASDHQVGNRVLFPATGFLEITLSVAAQVLGTEQLNLRNIEILRPLDLSFGKTHEVQTRLSPAANVIEILSRPRLSTSDWILNIRCKIFRAEMSEAPEIVLAKGAERPLTGDGLYRIAHSCGLNYGPAFRLGARLGFHDDNVIAIELEPKRESGRTDYLLDPVRSDACMQGFIAILPELKAAERGVAYIPVRVDDVLLLQAHRAPQRAVMKIRRKSEHSIFADTDILAEDGSLIASLRGIRFQALPVRRLESVEAVGLLASLALADRSVLGESEPVPGADAILAAAKQLTSSPIPHETDAVRLQEKWALSAAYEIVGSLARGRTLDLEQIANEKRLPSERMAWLVYLLRALEKRELASHKNGAWEIYKEALPPSGGLLKEFIGVYPQRAAEILVMSELSGFAARAKEHGSGRGEPVLSGAALEFLHSAMAENAGRDEPLWTLLKQNVFAADCATRVLQIGAGPITQDLLSANAELRVTVLEPQESRLNRAQLAVPKRGEVVFTADLTQGSFDLVIAADGLDRLPASITLNRLRDFVAPGGMLVGITAKSRLFHDLVFGAERSRPTSGDATDDVMLRAELEGAGFTGVRICPLQVGAEEAALFVALQAPAAEKPAAETVRFLALAVNDPWARSVRARLLQSKGAEQEGGQPALAETIVQILGGGEPGDADALTAQCLTLRDLAQQAEKGSLIVLVFCDALGVHPVSAGLWAFARTLANEFPKLEFKRIDIAAGVPPALAAQQIARLLNAQTAETELRIEADALRVVRVDSLRRRPQPQSQFQAQSQTKHGRSRGQAARLELSQLPGGRVEWKAVKRIAPKPDEIEIAVEATGLNFRDLMWSLRLLPDDILEDGCTGPTLGLECAGRIVRVGADVEKFEVGDPVLAMTGNAFSSFILTIPEARAEKLPSGMSFEAAATIPVTFLTAYYSLVTLANLKPGEWVLVHGGAGGVGLAAIQIAKSLGAKVIATAGSGAKRELLMRMGADHVLESRSTGFVEGVRKLTKTGADVILNSLAQEAMEQSLACLAPFGRFVELGKRDYVADTQIGVRVFRKNASYFGVDVDQLMARGDLGSQLLKRILKEFKKGVFKPLLHTVFDASGVGQAFGLMQQSAHVGKIIVRPPAAKAIPLGQKIFQVDRAGTHLVTGAFRGLGLETAKWLVERGARNLVLIGRSGPVNEEALAALADFSQRGVKVLCEKCDVADAVELEQVFARAKAQLPPITGIIHSAMVLDDGLIANLDETRLRTVLAPKVTGARNLDCLSRDLALDYFVLFSSVTTLMGNPGQGNYVAANAFLEGLARQRRSEGLPALAIGWGPITDVGVVARSEKLKAGLKRLTGARGMTSQEALALMAQALELSHDDLGLAVMTIAPNDGSFGDDRLKVLRSPTYAPVLRARGTSQEAAAEAVDILALAKTVEAGVVARKVGDLIVEHLSRVLHAREDVINRTRPLGEIGLDSLMAVELAMNLEGIFGVTVALAGSSASLTVVALAEKIVSQIMGSAAAETSDPIPVSLAPIIHAAELPALPANDVGLPGTRNAPDQKLPAE